MLIAVILFVVGLLCLIWGGDKFVDGAIGVAARFHVPELIIGCTVVSIGTTLPDGFHDLRGVGTWRDRLRQCHRIRDLQYGTDLRAYHCDRTLRGASG